MHRRFPKDTILKQPSIITKLYFIWFILGYFDWLTTCRTFCIHIMFHVMAIMGLESFQWKHIICYISWNGNFWLIYPRFTLKIFSRENAFLKRSSDPYQTVFYLIHFYQFNFLWNRSIKTFCVAKKSKFSVEKSIQILQNSIFIDSFHKKYNKIGYL